MEIKVYQVDAKVITEYLAGRTSPKFCTGALRTYTESKSFKKEYHGLLRDYAGRTE